MEVAAFEELVNHVNQNNYGALRESIESNLENLI